MNDSVLVKLDRLFDKLKTASDGDDWNAVRGLVAQVASLVKVYEKPLPEEPKERGFYVTANDGRLLLKDIDDDWSACTYDNSSTHAFWKNGRNYVKWPTVCETLPPEAFPLKRVNIGERR
ncbi:hypothetical protein BIFAD42_19600 [Bifidobacterium adolescentis]|uniref:Uncharacterized protein n=1 Tax=Bifidobacterium adolescentis TaxID=1680 RepID=A0AAN4VPM9_BIFAD|nr:hypothetical protein [Bifidobacterium adolescentis]GJD14976.1 hypothetical protein BIFAD42_19600 [Bifidobacterium adolescentis]